MSRFAANNLGISGNFKMSVTFALSGILISLIGLISFVACCSAAYCLPNSVKVILFQAHPDVSTLTIDGPFEMSQAGGASAGYGSSSGSGGAGKLTLSHLEINLVKSGLVWTAGRTAKAPHRASARLVIRPLTAMPLRLKPGSAEARPYRGRFIVTAVGGKLNVVNEVDSKSYITSVVGSESAPEFPLEALKAQAVLATTVLARQRPNMKLFDSTDVQAYLGSDYERPLAKQAVAAVFGETLKTASGTTPAVFYHSTCAGGTSDEREIFSGKVLNDAARKPVSSCRTAVRVKCNYCQASPFFKPHVVRYSVAELKQKVGFVPLSIDVRDPQGRPLSVTARQLSPDKKYTKVVSISGYALWLKLGQGLGWGAVPGMRYSFEITPETNAERAAERPVERAAERAVPALTSDSKMPSRATSAQPGESKPSPADKATITITSSGAGHGAGLCQWGAAGMARQGKNYKDILHYYFPLAEVSAK